jgi:hypothetical protein
MSCPRAVPLSVSKHNFVRALWPDGHFAVFMSRKTKRLGRRKRRVSATHTAPRPYVATAPRGWELWGMPWPQFHCDRRVVLAEQLHISVLNFPDSDRIMPATVDSLPPIYGG